MIFMWRLNWHVPCIALTENEIPAMAPAEKHRRMFLLSALYFFTTGEFHGPFLIASFLP
jgi:hypothetical protein